MGDRLPIAEGLATKDFFFVRVHRRTGKEERMLCVQEIGDWVARLQRMCDAGLAGPIYFLWGTDWEDVPMR